MATFNFFIPTSNIGNLNISLKSGETVFVLGANGVGKSTLMYTLNNQNYQNTKRILAHRQTWFPNNSLDMSSNQRKQTEANLMSFDNQMTSRWKDDYAYARSSISIYDLISSENARARNIADAIDSGDINVAQLLANEQAPLKTINELLSMSNIDVRIFLDDTEQLVAAKNGCNPYSISELSDGERNALLICSDVLTAKSDTLVIIDEPERHLHRSIISPLLSSLFQKRADCAFVVSTHDTLLPIDNDNSSILLVRSCQWRNNAILTWDADIIKSTDNIATDIKKSILGAKKNILFVEGDYESLDRQIYQLIYPNVTVIPQGNCAQVERAVIGIKNVEALHWLNAYGVVDADDRTDDQIQDLISKGVIALNCYSVESLYYHSFIIKKVATRYASITGEDEESIFNNAISAVVRDVEPHKQRLCARLCEKKVKSRLISQLPKHQDILLKKTFELSFNLEELFINEVALFDEFVSKADIDSLIARYPIRETPVLNNIAKELGLTRSRYESIVRKLVVDDFDTLEFYKLYLAELTSRFH